MIELNDRTICHRPHLTRFERDGVHFLLDGEAPNWIATDDRGARIMDRVDGRRTFGDLVREYAASNKPDMAKAWLHVHDFLRAAIRHQMITTSPPSPAHYTGRADYLKPTRLNEFWLHTNNSCNLTCIHCLVSSHPGGDPGQDTPFYLRVIDETTELGVHRFYFTGGEPFLRKDIFELIHYVTVAKGAELIILTNATLFRDAKIEPLKDLNRQKLKFQVSLDGSTPQVNDPIRGAGTFKRITEGLKILGDLGYETSLTAVVMDENLQDMPNLPRLAKALGAQSLHLMWPHRRGRLLELGSGHKAHSPLGEDLLWVAREVKRQADFHGIRFDNYESLKLRVNGRPGVKYDLGNACWDSLCLYSDGHLYPSASFAGYPSLDLGDVRIRSIKEVWLESPLAKEFRQASVLKKFGLNGDAFKFITGGGDIEHSFFYSNNGASQGDILGQDPYYGLYVELMKDLMQEMASQKRSAFNLRTGYNPPMIYHAMGEGAVFSGAEEDHLPVSTLHSNCVLSFDVELPRKIVQEFYEKAAEEPKAGLCCPVNYQADEISHIPEEVLDRFYGCGSPVTLADLKAGETLVDLGSGGGIDCFIAARKVGPTGRVIGVDMTDRMLEVANRNKLQVAGNLGYDAVEFRKGYLEEVPVETGTADLITSNCVINLSPDKPRVFSEIWRILKDHGRVVISDIVSEHPLPPHIRANEQLLGECIAGALTEEAFLSAFERAGFYGLSVLKKVFWKEIEEHQFYSVTVRGYKYEKKIGCVYVGQRAIYHGPFKAVVDEEGHLFPRNEAVEVCTDTAAKLKNPPYAGVFTVTDPDKGVVEIQNQDSAVEPTGCRPGCC